MSESKVLFEEVLNATDGEATSTTITWNGLDIEVKKTISLTEAVILVDNVVSASYSSTTGEYRPDFQHFTFEAAIITFFTNIELSNDSNAIYQILYGTSLFDTIRQSISQKQLSMLHTAVEKRVNYLNNSNIERVAKEINRLIDSMNAFDEEAKRLLEGISQEDINKIMSAFSSGEFNMDKLVTAIANKGNDKEIN